MAGLCGFAGWPSWGVGHLGLCWPLLTGLPGQCRREHLTLPQVLLCGYCSHRAVANEVRKWASPGRSRTPTTGCTRQREEGKGGLGCSIYNMAFKNLWTKHQGHVKTYVINGGTVPFQYRVKKLTV